MDNNFNSTDSSQPISNSPQTNNENPTPTRKWILGALIAFVLIGGAFRLGYVTGSKGFAFDSKNFVVTNKKDSPTIVDYNLLWEALRVVQNKYIDSENIDPQKVLFGAIQGAVSAAGDEYTQFFDPKTYADFRTELQGTFSGIGAEIGKKEGNIVVISPLADSPAEKAGVRANDFIISINGESTSGLGVDEAVSKIRGEEGTQVVLGLFREGNTTPIDITITRQKIEVKSVKLEYKEVQGKRVALLTITRFGDDTQVLFDVAVADIVKNNPAGIIVDVRNNPGGYLNTSVDVSSDWLEKGKLVVKEEHSEKDVILYNSEGSNRLGKFKTIVLINGGSASASEIMAGALKDNGKAILIGEKSFGKGSVQELVEIGQGAAVKVTIAKWITPSGKNLNNGGLEPDIVVELKPEDITEKRDPQLDRALEEMFK